MQFQKPASSHATDSLVSRFAYGDLKQESVWLKNFLDSYCSPVVFCHRDLQEGNIIFQFDDTSPAANELNESDGAAKLHFFDFEYAGYDFRGFDFGNHFGISFLASIIIFLS